MTEYVKAGSDRPDFFVVLRHLDGRRVDLSDAAGVQFVMFDAAGVESINDPASVAAAHLGEVTYDFDAAQLSAPGAYRVEVRVDWPDGDDQWFPIDAEAYPLRVVAPPADRGDDYGETAYGDASYGGGVVVGDDPYGERAYGDTVYGGEA